MSDQELDRMVAEAAPIGAAELAALDLAAAESELIEEIMATPPTETPDPRPHHPRGRLRPRLRTTRVRLGAALAGAAAVAALVLAGVGLDRGREDQGMAFAAEWVRIAERNPRLLVTEPGWTVTRADEYEGAGEMTFSDGTHELDVHWRRAEYHDDFLRDRAHGNPKSEITVLDGPATMFRYAGSTDYTTLLPPEGETFLEIRGDLGSEEAYLALLDTLEPTDVETWLSAMPSSVVAPIDRGSTVDEMLEGVPLPRDLDLRELRSAETVSDRYQLGAEVTGTVACAWLDQWLAARKDGYAEGEREAVDAMATSREWPILEEMRPQGGWSPVVWELADAMAAGQRTLPAGKDLPIEKWAASSLGCSYR